MDKTLIVLVGPTGVGKTDVSLRLARHYAIPVINADSRQLFAELPIGTAAPTAAQQQDVRHYFVGCLHLRDYYSASMFETDVMNLLPRLFAASDTALLSGGSMMYVDAVCNGIDDMPTVDEATRTLMRERYEREGLDAMLRLLGQLDPEYYARVDRHNHKRVVHALEICVMTGRTYTSFRKNIRKRRPFRIVKIGLRRERGELYDRINRRVDAMIEAGLVDEARGVYPLRGLNALNTVGYKQLFDYFDGRCTLDEAVEKIKSDTRRYCRKQQTWFRRDPDIRWFHPDDIEEIIRTIGI